MKILVFQHAACEHPGSFREVMAARGATTHTVELDQGATIPALADFDILLVMGGPMDVWEERQYPWLTEEIAAIRDWMAAGKPFLGMCLGAQLLAVATGGMVAPMTGAPEVGMSQVQTVPDPIFAGVSEPCTCFQWHGAEVTVLPPRARLLASSPGCRVQAFAIGAAAYGLQFHMELTDSTAAEWGSLPEYAAALERVRGSGALPEVQREVAAALGPLQAAARRLFNNFLDIAVVAAALAPIAAG